MQYYSKSPEMTQKLGELLGGLAQPGDTVLLVGNLGSGKTCLTQGIARGLGIKANVVSPTFVLVREYAGRIPLYHVDLYRLDNVNEVIDLGLEQYLESNGICVIEWAEKGNPVLPVDNLLITISRVSVDERNITLEPSGKRYAEIVKALKGKLEDGTID